MLFHESERDTVWVLDAFATKHPDTILRLEFSDGESYLCVFLTAYESDNSWELDEGLEEMPVEYFALGYRVIEVIREGRHGLQVGEYFEISYRDFPALVITEDGAQIYPASK